MKTAAFVSHRFLPCGLLVAWCLLLAGCDTWSPPPEFHLNRIEMIDKGIPDKQQQDIATVLRAMFGTPDDPNVLEVMELDANKIKMAAGPAWSDQQGTKHGLYRRHCVHCHGITGDGNGPTAQFLNPYPRDFREGIFKFKSTATTAKPTREDLLHTLRDGVPGTAMPSFKLLPPDELEALVEYVQYLSLRGQTDTGLAAFVSDELEVDDPETTDVDETDTLVGVGDDGTFEHAGVFDDILGEKVAEWTDAADQVVRPDQEFAPTLDRAPEQIAASAAKGRELFFGAKAVCFTCHGPTGLGDGQTTDYDSWNTTVNDFLKKHPDDTAADVGALPVRTIRPRNLRTGVYRGGGRPLDLYRRMHAGINGTPMPAVGTTLTSEEIWQLVDYVMALPYQAASQPPGVMPPDNRRERH